MNEIISFLIKWKIVQKVRENNIFIGISKGFFFREFHRHSSNENVLKNKEINRNKKQEIWMKKINSKELPRKKFGNQLGTVARKLYLKYLFKNNKEDVMDYNERNCGGSLEKNYYCKASLGEKNNEICNDYDVKIGNKDKFNSTHITSSTKSINELIVSKNESAYKQKRNEISRFHNNEISSISKSRSIMNTYDLNEQSNKCTWDDVCNELKYHLPFLQPYSITTALNYLSKVNYNEYNIFKLIAENIDERWIKNFNIKDLSLLLLSYSRISSKYDSFINLVSRELLFKICYGTFEDISQIAYSYTKMKKYDYEVFVHLCNETKNKIKSDLHHSANSNSTTYNLNSYSVKGCNGKTQNNNSISHDIKNYINYNVDVKNTIEQNSKNDAKLGKEEFYHTIVEKENSHDKIGNIGVTDSKNKSFGDIDSEFNSKKGSQNSCVIKSSSFLDKEKINDKTNGEIKEDKKYSYICLLVYCTGKMKHCDNSLFDLISKYINFDKLNNIDISNLSYTFSLYNFYKNCFYEKFCLKSIQIIHLTEPLHKVIIMTYLLKYPKVKMLHIYFTYIFCINKEIKENKNTYKQVLFLNMCINSFSFEPFLNFLLDVLANSNKKETYDQSEDINKVCFIVNSLVDYTIFFMQNKNMSSRDFPKVLIILFKIRHKNNDQSTHFSLSDYDQMVPIKKVDALIDEVLDKVINNMKQFHTFDLVNIRNILNLKGENENIQFGQKKREILNFIGSLKR
ncbi:conserved Plasmodium protein, unknown function [Plasmodium malariae]|uniref:Uncharacterized protein n=1 Tax=Plasmodium malariae TaxID=5858 RepID=A0A1A8VZI8_PLAMA|nr:conserved Plasmodium protein, unknown function [Plasmodium malariae]SBS85913.1 conserved Plasmodium protein, unknown function [Plasmodium malariae]SCN12935.1 conserved Plasmodium protein, unknown function [Plasmodium malariae]